MVGCICDAMAAQTGVAAIATTPRAAGLDSTVLAYWLLLVACAWCFVGHGAWGLARKPGWLPLYGVFAVPEWLAFATMPIVGAHDIVLGILVLIHPCRAALLWMGLWCIFTALLRPLAGMGWWEFLERGGNYAPPLALLALSASQAGIGWFGKPSPVRAPPPEFVAAAQWILRGGIAALMVGHGGFGAFQQKAVLVEHWAAIGIEVGVTTLRLIGWAEIAAGLAVLVVHSPALLVGIAVWKVLTESLYPLSGTPMDVFEWIERGGDYFAPLALIALSGRTATPAGAQPGAIPRRDFQRKYEPIRPIDRMGPIGPMSCPASANQLATSSASAAGDESPSDLAAWCATAQLRKRSTPLRTRSARSEGKISNACWAPAISA